MTRGRKDYEKAVIAVESEGFQNPHGRILMYDDFEDAPLKWLTAGAGTWSVSRQAAAAYNRSYGMQLDTDTMAVTYRLVPIDVTKRLLLEFFWQVELIARLVHLEVVVRFFDGNRLHYAAIGYYPTLGVWLYWNSAGGWIPIPGSDATFYDGAWNELTMSVDFSTDKYIVFKSNNIEVNIGELSCQNSADGSGAHAEVFMLAEADGTNELIMNVDDVVLRELER